MALPLPISTLDLSMQWMPAGYCLAAERQGAATCESLECVIGHVLCTAQALKMDLLVRQPDANAAVLTHDAALSYVHGCVFFLGLHALLANSAIVFDHSPAGEARGCQRNSFCHI